MDHIKILKRAWEILWKYRVLWVFGIILALTTTSGPSGANGTQYTFNQSDFNNQWNMTPPDQIQKEIEQFFRGLEQMPKWQVEEQIITTLIAVGIGLACVILILVIVGIIARNVSETALIRLVDDYEETGEKRTFREGFRMGWSKAAVRLFLINLTSAIPMILVFLILGTLSLVPLLLWFSGNPISGVFGTISTIGLGFLSILFLIVIAVVVKVLLHFVRRVAALENLGVIDAYKKGFEILRGDLLSIFLMWLIMLGVQIGTALIMIPLVLLTLVVSGIFSGVLFLIVRGLSGLFMSGAAVWILSGAITLPVFILLLAIPLAFASGLIEVYKSTVWTLTYRELTALKTIDDDKRDETNQELKDDQIDVVMDDVISEDGDDFEVTEYSEEEESSE
jgi:hypothetical protein